MPPALLSTPLAEPQTEYCPAIQIPAASSGFSSRDAVLDEGAAWYLQRMRLRPETGQDGVFCHATFVAALAASSLNRGAKLTMQATLGAADNNGMTSISGAALAKDLGIRHATVSDHWNQARGAGLMLTRRRFNTSSIQQLTWPGSGMHPPEPGASPLGIHPWTDREFAWWDSLLTDSPQAAPWGGGHPPF